MLEPTFFDLFLASWTLFAYTHSYRHIVLLQLVPQHISLSFSCDTTTNAKRQSSRKTGHPLAGHGLGNASEGPRRRPLQLPKLYSPFLPSHPTSLPVFFLSSFSLFPSFVVSLALLLLLHSSTLLIIRITYSLFFCSALSAALSTPSHTPSHHYTIAHRLFSCSCSTLLSRNQL